MRSAESLFCASGLHRVYHALEIVKDLSHFHSPHALLLLLYDELVLLLFQPLYDHDVLNLGIKLALFIEQHDF